MPFSSYNVRKEYQRMLQSAADLVNKKQVAKTSLHFFKDPNHLREGFKELQRGKFKYWSCPRCGITVFGPRSWLRAHMRKCYNLSNIEGRSIIRGYMPRNLGILTRAI